jgi:hypothetical protein
MGNGNIDDYFGDGLDTNGLGQIGGESELPVNEQPKTNNKPKPDTGRKQQDPADKAPKAVLPAPVRKN